MTGWDKANDGKILVAKDKFRQKWRWISSLFELGNFDASALGQFEDGMKPKGRGTIRRNSGSGGLEAPAAASPTTKDGLPALAL